MFHLPRKELQLMPCKPGGETPRADDRIGFFGQYGTHADFMAKNAEFAKSLPPPEPIQERPAFMGIPLGPWEKAK